MQIVQNRRPTLVLVALAATLALIISACNATAADDTDSAATDDADEEADASDDATTEPEDDATGNDAEGPVPPDIDMIVEGNVFVDDVRGAFDVDLAEYPEGIDDTRSAEFDFADGNQIFVAELTFEPEVGMIPWHTHPGPIAASVVEGEFTVTYTDDCVARTYETGESFLEWGDDVHMGQNLSDEETRVVIVPMGIPEGEEITQPVDQEADDWEQPC